MRQEQLIERAINKAGTGRALAQSLGRAEPRISHWKKGTEPMPDEAIAQVAVYLGEDPIETLARVKGGAWATVAAALKEKISAGFDWLRLLAKPRRSLFSAR